MITRTHFAHRINLWDSTGDNIIEHLAGVEDFELALATYRVACQRWAGLFRATPSGACL